MRSARGVLHLVGIAAWAVGAWTLVACSPDDAVERRWIVVPAGRFVPGTFDPAYPACPSPDTPLACADDSGCCGEGFPYACPALDRCYAQPPGAECPSTVTCEPPPLLITSIAPDDARPGYGEPVRITVRFRNYGGVEVSALVLKLLGVDGRFEVPVAPTQAGAEEEASAELVVVNHAPTAEDCAQECSQTGGCEPCFAESPLPAWRVAAALRDAQGASHGTLLDGVNLSVAPGEPHEPPAGYCSDGSECCTRCGDHCLIDQITTPEDCACPANTTDSGVIDVHYHLRICRCNDC